MQRRKRNADRDSGFLVELTLIYLSFPNPANLATKSLELRVRDRPYELISCPVLASWSAGTANE